MAHPSIPKDIGINGNSSLEFCSEIHEREFGEPILPLKYYPEGPLHIDADNSHLDSKYPLEGEITDVQKNETKRLWVLACNRMAQQKLKSAYIQRWLRTLTKHELIAELQSKGVEVLKGGWGEKDQVNHKGKSLTHWQKRTLSQEELIAMWQAGPEDL